jgi:hypothetical protein
MDYPLLSAALSVQLGLVEQSGDDAFRYSPCEVTLRSGQNVDRVYVAEAKRFLNYWGDDPKRQTLALGDVAQIRSSPARLPAKLANKLYSAGESGMGYVVFTIVMSDGTRLPFVTGNAVDFPNWPAGSDPTQAVDVLPHTGREHFTSPQPDPAKGSASYYWCLYS